MAQADNADNPRVVPGHNGPPSIIDDAWGVYRDVSGWMEGAPVIESGEQAAEAKLQWDRAKAAAKDLEAERVSRVKPLNDTVDGINADFKKVSKPLGELTKELQARMSAFALAEERRKAAEAAALRKAAEEAEAAAREAERLEQEAKEDAAAGCVVDVGAAIGDANEAFADYQTASREAARAGRDVKGRIAGGFGRAFSVRTTRTLTIADPVKVVVALLEKTGRVPEKVTDALLTAVRDFEKTFGTLPAGVSVEHVRG